MEEYALEKRISAPCRMRNERKILRGRGAKEKPLVAGRGPLSSSCIECGDMLFEGDPGAGPEYTTPSGEAVCETCFENSRDLWAETIRNVELTVWDEYHLYGTKRVPKSHPYRKAGLS